ncbi:hypothetical protein [Wocania ichthyoenteri]|uniref:hypothetical protein n=1 Tax=Wocania ichthyoenteri TaxID=1230531 RepID=UPI00053E9582|nr:hypothetical protein [Wocania ichthyoenteri]
MVEFVFLHKNSLAYLDDYYAAFGSLDYLAKSHPGFYKPNCAPFAVPDTAFVKEIRTLATDMSAGISQMYHDFFTSNDIKPTNRLQQIAKSVSSKYRHPVPSIVRLDVIPTTEGLRVVEVNCGNVGGACTFGVMEQFLVDHFNAKITPKHSLTCALDALLIQPPPRRVISVYDGISAKLFAHSRETRIKKRYGTIDVKSIGLHLFATQKLNYPKTSFYLDLSVGNLLNKKNGKALRSFFSKEAGLFSTSPIYDRFFSSKALITRLSKRLPKALNVRWNKWMINTQILNYKHSKSIQEKDIHYNYPIILKPSIGSCGENIKILTSFNQTQKHLSSSIIKHWVVQPFKSTVSACIPNTTGTIALNPVYGVFLIREGDKLVYKGTSIRYSQDKIVNLGRQGELGLLIEPEWEVDIQKLKAIAQKELVDLPQASGKSCYTTSYGIS